MFYGLENMYRNPTLRTTALFSISALDIIYYAVRHLHSRHLSGALIQRDRYNFFLFFFKYRVFQKSPYKGKMKIFYQNVLIILYIRL